MRPRVTPSAIMSPPTTRLRPAITATTHTRSISLNMWKGAVSYRTRPSLVDITICSLDLTEAEERVTLQVAGLGNCEVRTD